MPIRPRAKKFLEALPKHKNKVLPAAIEAGYSENYARANGRTIYKNAVKSQAKEIIEMIDNKEVSKAQVRQLMADIVGLSPDSIMQRLRDIATQDKDLGSALKVLIPLARELGVEFDSEAAKVTVPTLIVNSTPVNPVIKEANGLVEP